MIRLKQKIFALSVFVLIVSALAVLVSVRLITEQNIKELKTNEVMLYHDRIEREIDNTFKNIVIFNTTILGDWGVADILRNNSLSIDDKEESIADIFTTVGINDNFIGGVRILHDNHYYSYNLSINEISNPDVEYINRLYNSEDFIVICGIKKAIDGTPYLLIGKNTRNTATQIDICTFYYLKIASLISEANENMAIISSTNEVIYSKTKEIIGVTYYDNTYFNKNDEFYNIKAIDNVDHLVFNTKLFSNSYLYNNIDWILVDTYKYDEVFGSITALNWSLLFAVITIIVISIVLAFLLSNTLTKSLNNLIVRLKGFIGSNKGTTNKGKYSKDEIGILEQTYDAMIERIMLLINENEKEQESKRKLELDALQMQINPHFLYNTLDAIAWMAKIKKESEIEKLVLALAKFFRLSLHKGDKYITVEEEIELIKCFLEIELIRFPDKFSINYEIDEEVKGLLTLKLLLQPIVENAIKHGISALDDIGILTIKAYKKDKFIYYEIIDNGIGFDTSEPKPNNNHGGYGISNIRKRIALEYDDLCGVKIVSNIGGGTKVTINIRAQEKSGLYNSYKEW